MGREKRRGEGGERKGVKRRGEKRGVKTSFRFFVL